MTKNRAKLRWAGMPLMLLAAHCSSSNGTGATDSGAPADGSSGSDSATTPADGAVAMTDAGDAGAVGCTFAAGVDGGPQTYMPSDPNIRYVGRMDLTSFAPNVAFSESASYITANFMGDSVSIMVDEHNGGVTNYFETIIDGYPPVKNPQTVTGVAQHKIPIVPGYDDAGAPLPLPCGAHKITVVKRTEADYGRTDFDGFSFAQILPPDTPPTHKIEIIGDSITCGAGVEAASANDPECNDNFGEGLENGYYSYGADLARDVGAEWHVTCASGIGLVRNYYSRGDQRTMPEIYPYLDPEAMMPLDLTPWDTTQWAASAGAAVTGTPDAIVIGLGTNDFSRDAPPLADGGLVYRDPIDVGSLDGGLDAEADGGVTLEQGYVMFIDQLKADYPGVSVFLVSSPILGNNYPTPTDMQLSQHQQAIQDVAAYYTSDPNVHVYAVVVPKVSGTGCGGHPSVAQQAAAATTIATAMKAALAW